MFLKFLIHPLKGKNNVVMPSPKRRRFEVVKIPSGLTVKLDGVLELKFFETLRGYIAIF
jgi:hypothetical protein